MAKKMSKKVNSEATKYLAKVPEERVFWVSDGGVLRDMKEMAEALANMSEETFAIHVNESKNDFYNWVRDIIKDETLMKELAKPLTRTQAAKVVAGRVAFLSSK